jgi:hypothetical protein
MWDGMRTQVDPLEAFMAEINSVVVKETAAAVTKATNIEKHGDLEGDKVRGLAAGRECIE